MLMPLDGSNIRMKNAFNIIKRKHNTLVHCIYFIFLLIICIIDVRTQEFKKSLNVIHNQYRTE